MLGTRVAETILASGHARPHKQAGHMIASDPIKKPPPKPLARGGRPHMDAESPAFAGAGEFSMTGAGRPVRSVRGGGCAAGAIRSINFVVFMLCSQIVKAYFEGAWLGK